MLKVTQQQATVALVLLGLCAAVPRTGMGQTRNAAEMIRRELAIEQRTRAILQPSDVLSQGALFDYGGFLRSSAGRLDTTDGGESRRRTFRAFDLRIWTSLTLQDLHQFYFRVRTDFTDYNADQEFDGLKPVKGPFVDQAFYSVQLDEWAARRFGQDWPLKLKMTLGRQYIYIGSGIAYSQVGDGVLLEGLAGNWDLKTFASRTRAEDTNIDASETVTKNERYFIGLEVAYVGVPRHRQYAYLLIQEDESDEHSPAVLPNGQPATQSYDYDSRYLGVGATGEIIRNLGYRAEGILEWGKSNGDLGRADYDASDAGEDEIRAYAFNVGLDYFVQHRTKPRVSVDYFFASGDSDRAQPTNTSGGNRPGSADRGFLAFGFVDTGFNVSPQFSNIRVLRIDTSFRPMPARQWSKELEVGASYFHYEKDEKDGGISDSTASLAKRALGHEIDGYVNWRLLSDVTISLRYAYFMPGAAFTDSSARHFMFGTITYSF